MVLVVHARWFGGGLGQLEGLMLAATKYITRRLSNIDPDSDLRLAFPRRIADLAYRYKMCMERRDLCLSFLA